MRGLRWVGVLVLPAVMAGARAYEINNHADITAEALVQSVLGRTAGEKLRRLGLRPFTVFDERQRFPLVPVEGVLPEVRYCFGEYVPGGTFREYQRPANAALRQQDPAVAQPDWASRQFTIAELFRYGACFEDAEEPFARSLAHFYSVQGGGAGVPVPPPGQPNSLRWALRRGEGTSATGVNHYTWQDAREYFRHALTLQSAALSAEQNDRRRQEYWARTFQALGHVLHHLQDMASPQHVRADYHCNDETRCNSGLAGLLGAYRPSGYEYFFDQRFRLVRELARSASAPLLFGLPREWWSSLTDDTLNSTVPTSPQGATQGIAAHTATNFVSAGRDFRFLGFVADRPVLRPAAGQPLPEPATAFTTVPVSELFPATSLPRVRTLLCGGELSGCVMRFVGTAQEPNARTSALSVFSQEWLRPTGTYGGPGPLRQNFFTYADAAARLIPLAASYSAGLVDYFFRGELGVSLPPEGVYGFIDLGNPASNCKDACGFRKIRLRLTNQTASVAGAPQDMMGGELRLVVKFSRNACYTPDLLGEPGELNVWTTTTAQTCLSRGLAAPPLEEIVVSDPISGFSLAAGASVDLAFNLPTPLPVNAWNIKLQPVFVGQLGAEQDAVAVGARQISGLISHRLVNESDYILVNRRLYTRDELNANQTALAAVVPTSCVVGPPGARRLASGCFLPNATSFVRRGANNAVLASAASIPSGRHVHLGMLADLDTPGSPGSGDVRARFSASFVGGPYDETVQTRPFWLDEGPTPGLRFVNLGAYRGLHALSVRFLHWEGSADPNYPPASDINGRPSIATQAPIPLDSVGF